MELSALQLVSRFPISRVAFIGSGPLPMSSLCLLDALDEPELAILNIDHDAASISQARTLCEKLGRGEVRAGGEGIRAGIRGGGRMQFLQTSADSPSLDLACFDVIIVAALVGQTQDEKEDILQNLVKNVDVGALVVVRTAVGLRGLLYPV
jgi:nicotianamine synthase